MILLENISKRYQSAWIFKNINYQFDSNQNYALLGDNGSGKSTLLRSIANMQTINKGKIQYYKNDFLLSPEKFYKHYTFCAPAMEVIEDMTLLEFFKFHYNFKPLISGITIKSIIEECNLEHAKNSHIRDYSSGMKQRVKLAQAFFSQSDYLFLDEPCSNLDEKGIALYQEWMRRYGNINNRTVIVASNDNREYQGFEHLLHMKDYK